MANSEDIPGTPEEDKELNGKEQDEEEGQVEEKGEPEPTASDDEKGEGSGEEGEDDEDVRRPRHWRGGTRL